MRHLVKHAMGFLGSGLLLMLVSLQALGDDYLGDTARFTGSFANGFLGMLPNLTLLAGVILLLMCIDKFKKYRENKCENSLSVPVMYLVFGLLLIAYRWF